VNGQVVSPEDAANTANAFLDRFAPLGAGIRGRIFQHFAGPVEQFERFRESFLGFERARTADEIFDVLFAAPGSAFVIRRIVLFLNGTRILKDLRRRNGRRPAA
jgi:hypothetical protein